MNIKKIIIAQHVEFLEKNYKHYTILLKKIANILM